MSLADKYNIEDPKLREIITELEAAISSNRSVGYTDKPLTPNHINEIAADEIKIRDNKIYFRSGNILYSITGTKES